MRLKKKEAYIKAQENLTKRAKLVDKAQEKYNKAIDRLRKAESKLPTEELLVLQSEFPITDNITSTANNESAFVFTLTDPPADTVFTSSTAENNESE